MNSLYRFTSCHAPLARCYDRYANTTVSYLDIAPEEVWIDGLSAHICTPAIMTAFLNNCGWDMRDPKRFLSIAEEELDIETMPDHNGIAFTRAVYAAYDGTALDLTKPEAKPIIKEVATWLVTHAITTFEIGDEQGIIHAGELVTGGRVFDEAPTYIFNTVDMLRHLDYFPTTPICTVVNGRVIADRDLALDELPADAFDTAE